MLIRMRHIESPVSSENAPIVAVAQADVTGPQQEAPAGDASAEVQISPPPLQGAKLLADSIPVVVEPSRVFIASSATEDRMVH
jgi:hypothetical protein